MSVLKQLRFIGILEGSSYLLLLLVCMPLKYFAHIPQPTSIVGMAHGVLFVAYCSYILLGAYAYKWSVTTVLLGFLSSVLPFGPFVADKKLFSGRGSN